MHSDLPPHLDSARSPVERAAALLGQMTLAEKAGQLLQLNAMGDLEEVVLRRLAGSILHVTPERVIEAQRLATRTRLGIPLLVADDVIHGHGFHTGATVFPTQLGLAASWNADLVEQVARASAVEASATGLHWVFSPVLCAARDLRWGRVGETFGEDLLLIGELGAAMIRGYQGAGPADATGVRATAKHFAGYSETQGGRDASEADLSPRKLRSWFLPPFERAVREGVASMMTGYQSIDGTPITALGWLLDGVLRDDWGFSGLLVTDWDNVGRMVWEQQVAPDIATATARALDAGNDIAMATPSVFDGVQDAVRTGLLAESRVDQAVSRVLQMKFELGLFEDPRLPREEVMAAAVGRPDHRHLALEAARASLVLLRNDGTLPLDVTRTRRILVAGPLADDVDAQLGDWAGASGQVDWMADGHPRPLTSTVLDAVRELLGSTAEVVFSVGAEIGDFTPDPEETHFPDGQPRPPVFTPAEADAVQLDAAAEAAQTADAVIAVIGDTVALTGEGRSTATLELQGGQIALLERLVAQDTPVIVVLISSKPLVLPAAVERAAAVIHAGNPGMLGGTAIAELLWGRIEPTGRLPISYAAHAGQLPVFYHQVRGQHGHRYADLSQRAPFAFGEGLSYTTVHYGTVELDHQTVSRDDVVTARITVTNSGNRPTVETVQAYVHDRVTSVTWADRQLVAFRRVSIAPGESATVEFRVPVAECSIVDAAGMRVVEPGEFDLLIGPSSRREVLQPARFEVIR